MSLFSIFEISSSALSAQSQRLNLSASNMSNADSVALMVNLIVLNKWSFLFLACQLMVLVVLAWLR